MPIVTRRKLLRIGRSRGVTLPSGVVAANEVVMAVNNWAILDLSGRATGKELVELLARLEESS